MINDLTISTPGRVCLFGEHQDYLQLPIIACAISRRIYITGAERQDNQINIDLPDVGKRETFAITDKIRYTKKADYFKSSINVLRKNGFSFSNGFDCTVLGNIPINAGTSSSSALVVAWINFLTRMSDEPVPLPTERLGQLAYEAEVVEFNEAGGMMDQYSTAIGNIIFLSSYPEINIKRLPAQLKTFVLGDSGEPKDTQSILVRVKNGVLNIVELIKSEYPEFSLQTIKYDEINSFEDFINKNQLNLLKGTIKNRDITYRAQKLFNQKTIDHLKVGELLNEHHVILNDILDISTPKIESMISVALNAGAFGAKINGSGGGGCMFAYAPKNPKKVAAAIEEAGGKSYIVTPDVGTVVETKEIFE
jgi:galactokinase